MTEVSREDLVEAARALAPKIAARTLETEKLRRLPDSSLNEFVDGGFLRAFVPKEFGGYELPFRTVVDVGLEISRVCGSSGWCVAIDMIHNRMMSFFPKAAQEEVFGAGPDAVVCGVFMPGGTAIDVDGGFRLTGEWNFASTCDHAGHAMLSGFVLPKAEAAPVGMASFLVRREDFEIEDNWHVAGLAGTGSKRICVEDVFVPESWARTMGGGGMKVTPAASSITRLPHGPVLTLGLTGVSLGIALGALDDFTERLAGKLRVNPLGPSGSDQVGAQLRLGEASAEVDGAHLMVIRDCEALERNATAGAEPTAIERGRYRRDAAYAIQTSARAVARLMPASGAHSIFEEGVLQRCLRDTQVIATHIVADWDLSRQSYVRSLLGSPVQDPAY